MNFIIHFLNPEPTGNVLFYKTVTTNSRLENHPMITVVAHSLSVLLLLWLPFCKHWIILFYLCALPRIISTVTVHGANYNGHRLGLAWLQKPTGDKKNSRNGMELRGVRKLIKKIGNWSERRRSICVLRVFLIFNIT